MPTGEDIAGEHKALLSESKPTWTPPLLSEAFGKTDVHIRGAPDCKVVGTFLTACLGLLLMHFFPWNGYVPQMGMSTSFYTCFVYSWRHAAFMFALPALVVKLVLREDLDEYGWNLRALHGYWRYYIGLTPLVFGVIYVAAGQKELQQTYPFYHSPESWRLLLLWELLFGASMVFGEFFYRGFCVHGLKHRYGHGAVWVSTMAYFMIHMQKPLIEAAASIAFGIALAVLSLRTGSIAGGAWLHCVIAWSIDAAVLLRREHVLRTLAW